MRTDDFDYYLPEELIAQEPPNRRGESRMLVLNPNDGTCEVTMFREIARYLNPGDLLVLNNTKVIRARLFAHKESGAKIEIFLLGLRDQTDNRIWNCFLKPAKRVVPGTELRLFTRSGLELSPWSIRLTEKLADGSCRIEFLCNDVDDALRACGHLPLPPYIKREDAELDSERYQTVYAHTPGAVAAPTAGLHFTEETFGLLKERGVEKTELTLHVGAGTFKPVSVERIEEHHMHSEHYFLPDAAAEQLNTTRRNGKRILAVGTTSLRTLETCVQPDGFFPAQEGSTEIFLYPPYKIKSADMLLTNFHLPKSTLLMLVSAFAGTENIRRAYQRAIAEKMRFFSYGDCMLILDRIR